MKNNKKNKMNIVTRGIPLAAVLSAASAVSVSAATDDSAVLQVENSEGKNVEYVSEFMNNDLYRAAARKDLKTALLADKPVLISHDDGWVDARDVSSDSSFDAMANEKSQEFVKLNSDGEVTTDVIATVVESVLDEVDTYVLNTDGYVADQNGNIVYDSDDLDIETEVSDNSNNNNYNNNDYDDDYDDDLYNN
ncbi:MAG: hypothetical protein ACK5LV_07360 [Lachnospirales bacterium]